MDEQESDLSFERVVFFSDAVFAIVITLLVLELRPPRIEAFSEMTLLSALLEMLPKFIGFVASFLVIGSMWIEHHRIFRYITRYDVGLVWRNLFMLLCVSFLPFPTALFSEYYWSRTALILYAISFAGVGLAKLWVWNYAMQHGLLADAPTNQRMQRIRRRSWAVPLACFVAILLALVSVQIAPVGFALIPLFARLIDPTPRKTLKAPDEAGG